MRCFFWSLIMARAKRQVPLRQRYSLDLRMRVIHQKHTLKRKTRQIARDLDIPLRVVQRILKLWKDLKDLSPPNHRHNVPKLNSEHLDVCISLRSNKLRYLLAQYILCLIEQNPSVPLDSLQASLDATYGVQFHISTIWRTLNGIGIRNKRVSLSLLHVHSNRAHFSRSALETCS
jgi:transposase